jgi:hypothetical protein
VITHDRWLEMDLTWFEPTRELAPQIERLWDRITPLLDGVTGEYGLFFNVGWLIDLVTEWTGDPDQHVPTQSRRTALWAQQTYRALAEFVARLRAGARQHGLDRLKVGVLFVGWAHVVWPPELKIYDFDSTWYARHPELYAPPHSIINMPDLHPANCLHADRYPYAAFPGGLEEDTYFPEFFGAQWAHLARFLNLDVLLLRDGLTGPMIYTRNGPYGTSAPPDPQRVAAFSQSVRDLYRCVKTAAPDRLVFGYSSAISPVADWRVGCVDFEALIADGYIDGWIEQTWGGAWQDWWHQLWKGWTFQTANLLTRGAMIARANQQRATPCRFYNLIETWDGWEPWDTLHQVPHKLRWAIWAFSHAAVLTPDGPHVPDGSYISWMNNGDLDLLSAGDVATLAAQLNQAQRSAAALENVYGPALVYNRAMLVWLSEQHPDWNASEWIDDQAALLMKWGLPILSATRAEWLDALPAPPDALLLQTPGQLDDGSRTALNLFPGPVLATGRADLLDEDIRQRLGITLAGQSIPAGFHVCSGASAETPAADRPYLHAHAAITAEDGTQISYRSASTPLLTQKGRWLYWQPPDWSEPFNPFVPKYQLGSTFPHYLAAHLLNAAARGAGLSHLVFAGRARTIAFHLWRSAGQVHALIGNLETGEFGDSRTPRAVTLWLSRQQLQLTGGVYHLSRIDAAALGIEPESADPAWLVYRLALPPEQSAVFVLVKA